MFSEIRAKVVKVTGEHVHGGVDRRDRDREREREILGRPGKASLVRKHLSERSDKT